MRAAGGRTLRVQPVDRQHEQPKRECNRERSSSRPHARSDRYQPQGRSPSRRLATRHSPMDAGASRRGQLVDVDVAANPEPKHQVGLDSFEPRTLPRRSRLDSFEPRTQPRRVALGCERREQDSQRDQVDERHHEAQHICSLSTSDRLSEPGLCVAVARGGHAVFALPGRRTGCAPRCGQALRPSVDRGSHHRGRV